MHSALNGPARRPPGAVLPDAATLPAGVARADASVAHLEKRLAELLECGGPEPSEYDALDGAVASAWHALRHDPTSMLRLRRVFTEDFLRETLHGHAAGRPMGYPGDFLLIDKILLGAVTPLTPFQRWDEHFQQHGAAKAVRNRKSYLKAVLTSLRPQTVLNLGTGPGRGIAEYLSENPTVDVRVTSVDQDLRANSYARRLLHRDEDRAYFLTANLVRIRPVGTWDLIWSSGFFDYLEDRLFVRLLRRLAGHVRSGGEVVVGNFSPSNATRSYMELMGDWCLQHRTADDLIELALRAGFHDSQIYVGQEPLGINLFLHARKDEPHDWWERASGRASRMAGGALPAA